MKFKNLILAGLALVSMAACSNEDDPQTPNSGESYNAYMQLKFSLPSGENSRTEGQHSEAGSESESAITKALVLLCTNDNNRTVMHQVKLDYKDAFVSGDDSQIETQAFPVPCKINESYKVYVIANYNEAVTISTGSSKINEVITELSAEDYVKTNFTPESGFLMFNQSKGSDNYEGPVVTFTKNNKDRNTPAVPGSVIALDRLVAKITSTATSPNIEDLQKKFDQIASIKLNGYKLINGATKMYLQQHWAFEQGDLQGIHYHNTVITPWNPSKANPSALEFNSNNEYFYNSFANFCTVKRTSDDNVYPEVYESLLDKSGAFSLGAVQADPVYCLEHNPSYNESEGIVGKRNNTTGLLYQYQVTLTEGNSVKSAAGETALGDNTFFSFNGEFFPTLKALQTRFSDVFVKAGGDGVEENYNNALKELAAANITTEINQNVISEFRKKYLIKVYTNGIMYYSHFIKDTNYYQLLSGKQANDTPKENIGEVYAVLRNTVYHLNVVKLLNIGGDLPDEWNPYVKPDSPVETDNLYMKVIVTVNNWVKSDQSIELK